MRSRNSSNPKLIFGRESAIEGASAVENGARITLAESEDSNDVAMVAGSSLTELSLEVLYVGSVIELCLGGCCILAILILILMRVESCQQNKQGSWRIVALENASTSAKSAPMPEKSFIPPTRFNTPDLEIRMKIPSQGQPFAQAAT